MCAVGSILSTAQLSFSDCKIQFLNFFNLVWLHFKRSFFSQISWRHHNNNHRQQHRKLLRRNAPRNRRRPRYVTANVESNQRTASSPMTTPIMTSWGHATTPSFFFELLAKSYIARVSALKHGTSRNHNFALRCCMKLFMFLMIFFSRNIAQWMCHTSPTASNAFTAPSQRPSHWISRGKLRCDVTAYFC